MPRRNEKNVPTTTPNATKNPPWRSTACSCGLYSCIAISSLSKTPDGRHAENVKNDHRGKPAKAGVAGRAEEALARLARLRAGAPAREARRNIALAQGAGGRRHRYRHGRRAVTPAFR